MADGDVWGLVAPLRIEVADAIEGLQAAEWEAASWCAGWRVRDVLGHLVHLAEATQRSMVSDVLAAGGRPERALDRTARRLGAEPVASLAERLRRSAGGRFHVIGSPAAVALGEVIVHGSDALRPLGRDLAVTSEAIVPLLHVYRRIGRLAFHAPPARGRRLVATDADWSYGHGPETRGRAVDLLLLLANRPVALDTP